MRPVVFGPSPLMETALGVLKGQDLGRQRVAAEQQAQRERDAADRKAQSDLLTIAHQRIANDEAQSTQSRRLAKEAAVQSAAERLRASPFNVAGKFGQPGDPVDVEHDYAGDLEKESKVDAMKRALMATGMPEADAEQRARWNVDKDALAAEATSRRLDREKQQADINRIKAQTALDAARAAVERTSGGEAKTGAQEARDRARVAGWAVATMRAGEKDPQRLADAALAMNPRMNPQAVAAAVADAQLKLEQEARATSSGLPPLPADGTPAIATSGAVPVVPGAPAPPNAAAKSPADRWEELVGSGMEKAAATAQVKREYGLR